MATDIVDLVSAYVTLKRKGQNHFGLCPFHNEKTPSFSVNEDKQIFHCFGCGAGGNVFTFLMRHEGVSFPEAARMLAQRANIDLDWEEKDDGQAKENEALFHISEFAARWFQQMLFEPAGAKALEYLRNRGFSVEAIKAFQLGYAPDSWDGLIREATRTANDLSTLVSAGLVLEKEGGKRYDRFRDRIMFPIQNLSGRVIAFGGRIIQDQPNAPKYVNSPETPIYEKSKVLYGLFQNRDEIRRMDKAIFVEGYMDLLSLQAGGIGNAVATSGTALTQEQAALIRRYTHNILLMYDSDSAGSAATLRGADILIENGLEVYVATLPEGHDPDSFIREFGREALEDRVEQGQHVFEFKLNRLVGQTPEKRGLGIRALLESVARIKDRIQRSLVVSRIGERLHVSEEDLWAELQKVLRQKGGLASQPASIGQRLNDLPRVGRRSKTDKAVDDLVSILLHDWQVADLVFERLDFSTIEKHKFLPVLDFLRNQHRGGHYPVEADLLHHFRDVETTQFIVAEMNRQWENLDVKRWAKDCLDTIRSERLQTEIESLREELRQFQGDPERRKELLQRCMQLENEKKAP